MKRTIIVEHGGKSLSNILWNDLSIHAYALEVGAVVWNFTYLEHTVWGKWLHWVLARLINRYAPSKNKLTSTGAPKYLPPTEERVPLSATLCLFGWMFRNPVGMEKHRAALLKLFRPTRKEQMRIDALYAEHRDKILIGICNRTTCFPGFPNGEFLVSRARITEICQEYLEQSGLQKDGVVFIESDSVYVLACTRALIGDNSSLSKLAAWVGNIPHVVATEEPIDWAYYRGKNTYFDNLYATLALGSMRIEPSEKY